jgi:hypothetical protein
MIKNPKEACLLFRNMFKKIRSLFLEDRSEPTVIKQAGGHMVGVTRVRGVAF